MNVLLVFIGDPFHSNEFAITESQRHHARRKLGTGWGSAEHVPAKPVSEVDPADAPSFLTGSDAALDPKERSDGSKEEDPMGPNGPIRPGLPGGFAPHHDTWWGFVGHALPLVLFLALIAVAIWAVLRLTSQRPALVGAAGPAPVAPRDPAVDELRIRYARGELSREDFVQRARDLGAELDSAVAGEPGTESPSPDGS
jgi:putative membrane protein